MRISAKLTGALSAALLIAGCGGATATTAVKMSSQPTHATATSTPASPHAQAVMTAEQITAAMQREGYKTGAVIAYTAATDPNNELGRQGGYTSKTAWDHTGDTFNGIEVYPTTAEATKRFNFLDAFAGGSLAGDGYDYQSKSAVLRLSPLLTPKEAAVVLHYFLNATGV
jgi:hypothetical protein